MPAKLFLQLRLLNHPSLPSACFAPMKLGPPMSFSTASFSCLFPFKPKYHCLGLHRAPLRQTSRRFSTRPRSELSAGGRAPRSLVDDEADLSDWVSDLRDDSPRGGGGREDSGGDWGGRSSRVRDSSSGKRMRTSESESDEFDGQSRRRESVRAPAGKFSRFESGDKFSRNSLTNRRVDAKRDIGNREDFSQKKGSRFPREGNSQFNRRFDTKRNVEFSRNSQTNRRVDAKRDNGDREAFSQRKGPRFLREGNSQLNSRFDTKQDVKEREFLPHNKSQRFDEGKLGTMGKRGGGRDIELGFKKDGLGSKKSQPLVSDFDDEEDDDEDEIRGVDKLGIEDLLSDTDEEEDEDEDVGYVLAKGTAKGLATASTGKSESYLSDTRFDQVSVSPLSLKGIKDAGFEKMTVVQEATLPVILKGKDVLAKAKTGTGKTVAFLLPSIEVIVKSPPIGRDQKRPPIYVLVICPTRELACQAAAEANTLLKYHASIGVQVVIGGTRLALEQKRMQANPCQILVATPGRLRDHMENTAGFATRLMGVKVLVLDEADHLLDMGFRKDIERIIAAVPKERQTLLFSATVPEEVRQVCHIALKRDHEFINMVQVGSEDTHSQVRQMHLIAPLDKQFSLLYVLVKEHIADDVDYKVIVFCTTAMVTRLVAELLGELKMNVREIHSRKSQSYRTKVSDEFRKSKGLILVTSDVSARGVDYPDVTLVIQIGLPSDKQQYIHRLGRTGRKGKEGEGVLLLAPWEEFFLSTIKDLPIGKAPEPSVDSDTKKKVERAFSSMEMKSKEAAYQAWLGYYNSNKTVGRDKHRLVELANEFSRSMGLDNPPTIPKLVLGKMGLKNVPGLRSR